MVNDPTAPLNGSPDAVLPLFYGMLRIRMIEDRIAALYPEQEMRCPVHLSTGQEAVAVGACASLTHADYALSSHRSHAHYLAKGGDLKAMMAEIYGKATGCSKGRGGSMHLVDLAAGFLGATPIVGSTIPIAVGAALGSVMRGEQRVTAVFFGDGTTEEGVFHESLNFAVLKALPVVFVCENNLYSVYSPLSVRQPEGRQIVRLAEGHGMESHQGNGNDVVEVSDIVARAVQKARRGGGPTLLEFATYRWREHCGPDYDNDLGYRTEAEFLAWKERDPIDAFRARLVRDGVLGHEAIDALARRVEAEMDEAVALAKESPFPPGESLLEHVYAS